MNKRIAGSLALSFLFGIANAWSQDRIPIIFDTDFVMPPADDSMALMLALQSPEFEILGVTTVAGNESLERATSDVLRMLEIAGKADIPVYVGADMPMVHEKSDFAVENYGKWYSNEPPPEPPGGWGVQSRRFRTLYRRGALSRQGALPCERASESRSGWRRSPRSR